VGIVVKGLGKSFGSPAQLVLSDISLAIGDGELVALTGRSGSGKSTLLYVLSGLDAATAGDIAIDGRDLGAMQDEEVHRFRNEAMGFVFQFHYLLGELSALENVLMPARKCGRLAERRSRAESLLAEFGLGDKMRRKPRELSGGEQQRVAIARALVMEPRYVFADEPTGSLDTQNGELVMRLLVEDANRRRGATVVLVTHDQEFAARAPRQIRLVDGRVAHDGGGEANGRG
jgi:putative ABC transport system ATP-binding protein/lipoprotein-releasing system ATP-binding protein